MLSSFNQLATYGRLYTGGKVDAHHEGGFVVCPCGAEVNVIQLATGKILLTVPSDADEFTAFALRPDGEQIVTAGRSRQFRSWDLENLSSNDPAVVPSCECARVWKGHKMPVMDLTFEATGTLVASASADQTAMVFDVTKGACTHVFRGHEAVLHLVRFHPDQARLRLLTAAADNHVRVWDLHTRACVATLKSHVGLPTAIAFSPDGATLVTGGRDQLVNVWRCKDYALVSSITVLEVLESVLVVDDEDGDAGDAKGQPSLRFVTAGEGGLLRCWDAASGKCLRKQASIGTAGGSASGASTTSRPGLTHLLPWGGPELLSVSADHNFVTHSASSLQPTRCVAGNNDEITDIKCVVTTQMREAASSVTAAAAAARANPPGTGGAAGNAVEAAAAAAAAAAAPMPMQVAVATNSEQVKLFSSVGMDCTLLFGHSDIVLGLDVSPDGSLLGSASKDGTARVWRTTDGACVALCQGHIEAVGAIAFAQRGHWLLTGSKDKTCKMWDTSGIGKGFAGAGASAPPAAGKKAKKAAGDDDAAAAGLFRPRAKASVVGHTKEINALSIAPNDRMCASGSQDRTVRLWNVKIEGSGGGGGAALLEEAGVLKGHKRAVWAVAFSPVDRAVASGSGDLTIKVWSVADFSCLRTLEGHTSSVLRVHWVAAGLQLLSSGSDGLVKLWSAKAGDCACTLDAHEDKVWALDVAETADGGLEVWSGSADAVLVRWRDCTEEAAAEKVAASAEHMQQEQEMQIAMYAKEFNRALHLALRLRQPRALRTVIEKLLPTEEGEAQLRKTLSKLGPEDLAHCLSCARDWNTTATHSLTAQRLIHALLKSTPHQKLRSAPQLKELLEALLPYTERHFERLDRLQQGAAFLSYMLNTMQTLDPTAEGGEQLQEEGEEEPRTMEKEEAESTPAVTRQPAAKRQKRATVK